MAEIHFKKAQHLAFVKTAILVGIKQCLFAVLKILIDWTCIIGYVSVRWSQIVEKICLVERVLNLQRCWASIDQIWLHWGLERTNWLRVEATELNLSLNFVLPVSAGMQLRGFGHFAIMCSSELFLVHLLSTNLGNLILLWCLAICSLYIALGRCNLLLPTCVQSVFLDYLNWSDVSHWFELAGRLCVRLFFFVFSRSAQTLRAEKLVLDRLSLVWPSDHRVFS